MNSNSDTESESDEDEEMLSIGSLSKDNMMKMIESAVEKRISAMSKVAFPARDMIHDDTKIPRSQYDETVAWHESCAAEKDKKILEQCVKIWEQTDDQQTGCPDLGAALLIEDREARHRRTEVARGRYGEQDHQHRRQTPGLNPHENYTA